MEVINSVTIEFETSVPDKIEYICTDCNKKFRQKRYLRVHQQVVHSANPDNRAKTKRSNQEKSFNPQCTICLDFFHSRNILKHLRIMHPETKLHKTCEICGKELKNEWFMNRHMENVHVNSRKFICTMCDFQAKRKENLDDHKQIHTEDMFSCDKCDYRGLTKRGLNKHKCGIWLKSVNCELCDFISRSKEGLRKHIGVSFCNRISEHCYLYCLKKN